MARFLFATALLSFPLLAASPAPELPGCKDMKLFTRLEGCIVMECSAKRSDGIKLQMTADRQEVIEGPATVIRYQCAPPATLDSVATDLAALSRKNTYNLIYQDVADPTSHILTAQRGSHWVDMDISPDDSGGVGYTISGVEVGPPRALNGEVCAAETGYVLPKGCLVNECTVKRGEKTEMRRTEAEQAVLSGPVHTSALSCPATLTTTQLFDLSQVSLKTLGFELVFTQREREEYSWLTMRSGKKWMELMSFQDGDSLAYQLTEVLADSVQAEKKP